MGEMREVRVGRSSVAQQKLAMAEWCQIFAKYGMAPPAEGLLEMFDEMLAAADKHLVFARGERIAEVMNEVAHHIAFDSEANPDAARLGGALLEHARDIVWAVNEGREDDIWL